MYIGKGTALTLLIAFVSALPHAASGQCMTEALLLAEAPPKKAARQASQPVKSTIVKKARVEDRNRNQLSAVHKQIGKDPKQDNRSL